ncbi:hypothetical protein AB0D66_34315 [Streptomyces sp. NPDC048270]|uniref:hypothetical protein n=1 Tax=Streptomyces sp. NPDC048270 TaxID=3154615 RepID=UPI0033D4192F
MTLYGSAWLARLSAIDVEGAIECLKVEGFDVEEAALYGVIGFATELEIHRGIDYLAEIGATWPACVGVAGLNKWTLDLRKSNTWDSAAKFLQSIGFQVKGGFETERQFIAMYSGFDAPPKDTLELLQIPYYTALRNVDYSYEEFLRYWIQTENENWALWHKEVLKGRDADAGHDPGANQAVADVLTRNAEYFNEANLQRYVAYKDYVRDQIKKGRQVAPLPFTVYSVPSRGEISRFIILGTPGFAPNSLEKFTGSLTVSEFAGFSSRMRHVKGRRASAGTLIVKCGSSVQYKLVEQLLHQTNITAKGVIYDRPSM